MTCGTEVVLEMDKTDMSRLKTATREEISVQLSLKLHGSEIFYPDIEEEINVVRQFDKSLKYVTYKINSNTVDPVPPQRANALHHIMQTQTLCTKSAPKKDTNEKKFTGCVHCFTHEHIKLEKSDMLNSYYIS